MKDRIFNALDSSVIQQYKLSKPEYPFKSSRNNSVSNNQFSNKQPTNATQRQPASFQHSPLAKTQSFPPNSYAGGSPFLPSQSRPINHVPEQYQPMQPQPLAKLNDSPQMYQPKPVEPAVKPNPTQFFTPMESPAAQAQNQPPMTSYMRNRAPNPGWNDPPAFTPVVKSSKTTNTPNETPQFFQPTAPAIPTMPPNNFNQIPNPTLPPNNFNQVPNPAMISNSLPSSVPSMAFKQPAQQSRDG